MSARSKLFLELSEAEAESLLKMFEATIIEDLPHSAWGDMQRLKDRIQARQAEHRDPDAGLAEDDGLAPA